MGGDRDVMEQDRIELALGSLADRLDTEHGDRSGARPRPWWPTAAAALVLAILATAVLVAPVRRAVADWFGIGSTAIQRTDADLPRDQAPIDDDLRTLSLAEAQRLIGIAIEPLTTSALGAPEQVGAMAEGGVLLGWSAGSSSLWVHRGDIPADVLTTKLVDADQVVRSVDGIGEAALLIVGDHVLLTPHRRIAARTVLLWTDEQIEYRLESDLEVDVMIEIARQLDAATAGA